MFQKSKNNKGKNAFLENKPSPFFPPAPVIRQQKTTLEVGAEKKISEQNATEEPIQGLFLGRSVQQMAKESPDSHQKGCRCEGCIQRMSADKTVQKQETDSSRDVDAQRETTDTEDAIPTDGSTHYTYVYLGYQPLDGFSLSEARAYHRVEHSPRVFPNGIEGRRRAERDMRLTEPPCNRLITQRVASHHVRLFWGQQPRGTDPANTAEQISEDVVLHGINISGATREELSKIEHVLGRIPTEHLQVMTEEDYSIVFVDWTGAPSEGIDTHRLSGGVTYTGRSQDDRTRRGRTTSGKRVEITHTAALADEAQLAHTVVHELGHVLYNKNWLPAPEEISRMYGSSVDTAAFEKSAMAYETFILNPSDLNPSDREKVAESVPPSGQKRGQARRRSPHSE